METAEISDPAAAAVFGNARQRKIVLALIPAERSLSELAVIAGMPLNLLHHHMRKFLRLGLVAITRRQPRSGAAIKFYRATAGAFFVPAELASMGSGEAMASRLRMALDRSRARGAKGVLYLHDEAGPSMRLVRDPDYTMTAVELWRELRLRDEDAAELAEAFRALLRGFEARSTPAGRTYIVHAALA
jgi:hypothetical protein